MSKSLNKCKSDDIRYSLNFLKSYPFGVLHAFVNASNGLIMVFACLHNIYKSRTGRFF